MNPPANIVEDLRWMSPPNESAWSWWMIIALVAGLLLAMAFGWWLWRRGKKAAVESPPQPHLIALKALREIRPLLGEENSRVFVVKVSQIVRIYIAGRFHLRAPHRSSEEFLWEAACCPQLSEEDQEMLARFLARCDRVKFARGRVTLPQMEELFQSAERFVQGTMVTQVEEVTA